MLGRFLVPASSVWLLAANSSLLAPCSSLPLPAPRFLPPLKTYCTLMLSGADGIPFATTSSLLGPVS